jgi:ribosomal protein S27E
MIELTCPHCGRNHQLENDSAGSRVTCHACGKKFKVPGVAKRSDAESSGASATNSPSPTTHMPTPQTPFPANFDPTETADLAQPTGELVAYPHEDRSHGLHEAIEKPIKPHGSETGESTPLQDEDSLDPLSSFSKNNPPPDPACENGESSSSENYEVALDLEDDEWRSFENSTEEGRKSESPANAGLSSPPLGVDGPESHEEPKGERWRGGSDVAKRVSRFQPESASNQDSGNDWHGDALPIDFEGEPQPAKTGGDEIRVKCSICDSVTWVKPSKAGKKIVCTDCGSEVVVPENSLPPSPPVSEIPQAQPQGQSGWRLSQPIDRPRRDLPESLLGDAKSTPASLHVSKIKRWGEPEHEPKQASDDSTASPPQPSPRLAGGADGPTVSEDPVDSQERPEWIEPKDFGLVEWLRDTVVIFRNISMYGAAIAVAFVCGAFGTVAKCALLYSGAENAAIMRIVGMCSMLFSMPCLFLAATVLAAVLMTMIQDGASNSKEIGNWPELFPSELFAHCAPMYVTGFIALAPGVILAEFIHLVGMGVWGFLFFPLLSGFALLPPMVLSAFREQSMFSVYSRPVYESVVTFSKEWMNFFVLCSGGVLVACVCMVGVGLTPFLLDIPFWLVIGLMWIVYGRWIGILARRLAWFIPANPGADRKGA